MKPRIYSNLKPTDAQTTVDKIEALWRKGQNDVAIAASVNLSAQRVQSIRTVFGMRKQRKNIFEASRPMKYVDFTEKFQVTAFSLPYDVADKLKLDPKKEYEIFASVQGKDQIVITINRKL